MSEWVYRAETGVASGTDITVANSTDTSAGFGFSNIARAGGGTAKYDSDAASGNLALKFTALTANDVGRVDISSRFSTNAFTFDMALKMSSYPSSQNRVVEVLNGTSSVMRLSLMSNGTWTFTDSLNANKWYGSYVIPLNTYSRIGFRIVQGSDETSGAITIAVYTNYSDTVPAETATFSTINFQTTANPINELRLGKITSATTWASCLMDDIQFSDTRTTLYNAPPAALQTVTINAGVDQTNIEPGSTVTLTGTTSSGSVTWSWVSGPNPTLAGNGSTRTFIAPALMTAQTSLFRATNGGVSDDISVTYLPATDGIVSSTGTVRPSIIKVV